ncbi:hypothetical protein [Sulfurimonas sp.]|jgi:hypothetical protein|uniref:hypothetical protein n=1 Tax=Sulfurimonas sp. TaxID=2022749 RepID=UPI0025DFBB9E|nr:hypothetical protein [Sulfurimonas sp.]MBT5935787.1 hypothetical protein [Sulfurimonas sp.]
MAEFIATEKPFVTKAFSISAGVIVSFLLSTLSKCKSPFACRDIAQHNTSTSVMIFFHLIS